MMRNKSSNIFFQVLFCCFWQRFFNLGDTYFNVEHFSEVFEKTDVEAALAAGIFHREEVPIQAVKQHMRERGIETR
jgi:hypothetical protein